MSRHTRASPILIWGLEVGGVWLGVVLGTIINGGELQAPDPYRDVPTTCQGCRHGSTYTLHPRGCNSDGRGLYSLATGNPRRSKHLTTEELGPRIHDRRGYQFWGPTKSFCNQEVSGLSGTLGKGAIARDSLS